MGLLHVIKIQVPSYETFRSLIEKLRVRDYSAKVMAGVTKRHLVLVLGLATLGIWSWKLRCMGERRRGACLHALGRLPGSSRCYG